MKVITLLLLTLFIVQYVCGYTESDYKESFMSWTYNYGKKYKTDEFHVRYQIFKENMDYVRDWNAQNHSTILGLNSMADLSNAEYRQMYLGTHIDASDLLTDLYASLSPSAIDDPEDAIDWRTKGVVTPIKDQGQCGSCWAFSATGSMEAAHQVATGQLLSLSEQNLLDCSSSFGNMGCGGGLMDYAFNYVIKNKGINCESAYPYKTMQGTCKYSASNVCANLTKYIDVSSKSEAALLSAVKIQPVSVAIDASHPSFQLYDSGVYDESSCSSTQLDHGVLAVGFGTDETSQKDYWIVKNSWGVNWGMKGYINMVRNKNNACGIATASSYPVV